VQIQKHAIRSAAKITVSILVKKRGFVLAQVVSKSSTIKPSVEQ